MGAPLGNTNGAKAKKWTAALERALARHGGAKDESGIAPTPEMKALDEIADKFVKAAVAGPSYQKGDPWAGVVSNLGDRLEGKAVQTIAGDPESPLSVIINKPAA